MKPKMKILIGYDGSECADAALDDLARAGLPAEAEVQLLSVAEIWLPPPPPSAYEIVEQAREVEVPADLKRVYARETKAEQEALALAERASGRLRTRFPGWSVSGTSSCGSPAWELVFRADQWKPNLVVVGSHGRTAVGRLVLGSVSQRVLTETHCSVRIARGRLEEPDTPVRIIVGLDGSPGSEAAAQEVAARTWPSGSEVQLIVVDDPVAAPLANLLPKVAEAVAEINEEDRIWAEHILKHGEELLAGSTAKVLTTRREGDPKRELVKAAGEWGADSIFVGSTGFSNRFERFVLGSVSAAVAARAHCSVEVIRNR